MIRLAKVLLALAVWAVCTGIHWDAVQVFAWAKMFTSNAETMSLREATARTFDPNEICSICEWVADNKESGASDSFQPDSKDKQPLIVVASEQIVSESSESKETRVRQGQRLWRGLKSGVPTPPPRRV